MLGNFFYWILLENVSNSLNQVSNHWKAHVFTYLSNTYMYTLLPKQTPKQVIFTLLEDSQLRLLLTVIIPSIGPYIKNAE